MLPDDVADPRQGSKAPVLEMRLPTYRKTETIPGGLDHQIDLFWLATRLQTDGS